jgi:hypothetical protein
MPAMTTIVAVAVVVILIAAIGFVVVQQRRQRVRRRVDPQHEPATNERDNRGEPEQELRTRQERVATLGIKRLTPESQQAYAERWTALQEQFIGAPCLAVCEADRLVTAAMAERGYPTEEFGQQQSELPVVYGRTLLHYRQVREFSGRVAQGNASTEDLRQAMVHYRVLFQELLDNSDELHHPQRAGQARDDQPAPQGDSRNGWRKGDTT